jgi:hypothetical protein
LVPCSEIVLLSASGEGHKHVVGLMALVGRPHSVAVNAQAGVVGDGHLTTSCWATARNARAPTGKITLSFNLYAVMV